MLSTLKNITSATLIAMCILIAGCNDESDTPSERKVVLDLQEQITEKYDGLLLITDTVIHEKTLISEDRVSYLVSYQFDKDMDRFAMKEQAENGIFPRTPYHVSQARKALKEKIQKTTVLYHKVNDDWVYKKSI